MSDEGRRPEFFRAPPRRPRGAPLEPASPDVDVANTPTRELAPATLEAPPTTAPVDSTIDEGTREPDEALEETLALAPTRLGHYELRGELGRGGMGVVYAAYDTKLDRNVAIKQLLGGRSGNQRRMVREALAMAKLSHPNVVPIYEIGERADSTFMVMELVKGKTLRGWQATPRTQDEILAVYKAAGRGLSAAHQKQLVHRDFKPDNVMVGDDGRVRVMDFGLASVALDQLETQEEGDEFAASERSAFDPLTRTGSILGTPAYMSPEQLRAQPADAASDQFAFCIALYEALYGERPFAGSSFAQLSLAVTSGEIREAPAGATVPQWLRELVCRGLAVEPTGRFESMQALLDAIVAGELAHGEDEREPPEYVFVAHDSRDKRAVLRLCEGLIDLGVRPWLDMWELAPGESWKVPLALARAPAVIACGGSDDGSALAARIEADPTTVYAAHFAARDGLGEQVEGVELDETRWDEGVLALARLVGVDHERTSWLELEAARAGIEPAQLSPYRGLAAFREQDARWMFGREEEVGALVEMIRADQTRFLTLIGASGSGKSSLLLGGVCPALRHGVLGDGVAWSIAYLRPGARPCEALAHAIVNLDRSGDAVADGLKIKQLRDALLEADDTLRLILGRRERGRLLLVIDQLEELFTEAGLGGEDESRDARAFVRNLLEATQELVGIDGRLWIAATLRADFVQRGLEIPELARALQIGTYFALPPMSEGQIRAAIERPAARVGYRVEVELIDKLVVAAAHQAGRLPLLQHVLRELWTRRDEDRRVLTHAAYAETGGLEGAIAVAAERALEGLREELGEPGEFAVRRLMTRLVHLGNRTSEDTRRRVFRTKLGADATTTGVLDAFVREARVLVAAEVDGVETVEIAHEALLREWATLVGWLGADREALELRQELAGDAQKRALARTGEYLWGRGRVEEARRVLGASVVELDEAEREFLEASERVVRRRRRQVQAGVAGALSIAAIFIAVVSVQNAKVEREKIRAEEGERRAEKGERRAKEGERRAKDQAARLMGQQASMLARSPGNELRALALGVRAVGGLDVDTASLPAPVFTGLVTSVMSVETRSSLTGHEGEVVAVAYSPDGSLLATASVDEVRLWSASSGAWVRTLEGSEESIHGLAFSPDGSWLATASTDKWARIWEVATGQELAKLAHEDEIFSVAFSPDEGDLATAGADGSVRVWALVPGEEGVKGEEVFAFRHDGPVRAVAFSPDRAWLASASLDGTARVWAASDGTPVATFEGHGGEKLHALAWSKDSARIVTGAEDGAARIWDASSGEELAAFEHGDTVFAVAFSPDETYLATGTFDDDAAHLWEIDPGGLLRSYWHEGPVVGVAFSPDGERLATASWDGAGKLWNVRSSEALRVLEGHREAVYAVAASADGSRIATASGDDTARLWDAKTGVVIAELRGHRTDLSAVSFSNDGAMLATASWDGSARLWDGRSGGFIRTLEAGEERVHALAFSADRRHLATAGADGIVRVWDVATGEVARTVDLEVGLADVLFSPDGDQLLCVTVANTAHLWASATGEALPFAHEGSVTAAAFSPDGVHLALATEGHTVRLWDRSSNTQVRIFDEGHAAPVHAMAFSADGARLATASEDGTARLWDAATGEKLGSFAHDGPVLDVAFTGAGGLVTASGDQVARVWALTAAPWLAWGCALLDSRGVHDDATQGPCASVTRESAVVAKALAEPTVIDGEGPSYEVVVEHGVEYVRIPGGTFWMGSPEGVGEDDEHPQHEVTLDGFYMARTELTIAQYGLFLEANPDADERPSWTKDPRYNQPDQPVVGLSWYDAKAYCEWAGCLLPTEAQWEYAARAGATTAYWFGDEREELDRFGWHDGNSGRRSHFVATKGANAFGLHDMAGNMWEWTLDAYGDYTTSPRSGDGSRHKPVGDAYRVVRGGSWSYGGRGARSGIRVSFDPGYRFGNVGFRPLRAIP